MEVLGAESTEAAPSDTVPVMTMNQPRPQQVGSQSNAIYYGAYEEPVVADKRIPEGYCQRCGKTRVSGLRSAKFCGHCIDLFEKEKELNQRLEKWNEQRGLNKDRLIRLWKVSNKPGSYPGEAKQVYDLSSCVLCHKPASCILSIFVVGIDFPVEGHFGLREFFVGSCDACADSELHIMESLQEGNAFSVIKLTQRKTKAYHFAKLQL